MPPKESSWPKCNTPELKADFRRYRQQYRLLPHVREKEKAYFLIPKNHERRRKRLYEEFLKQRINPISVAKRNESHRQDTKRRKRQMIEAYGGCCICCGEDTSEFLTIDHKTKEARKADRHKGGSNISGMALYSKLRRAGWPKNDYQLLCMNCNFARGKFGECPHQKSLSERFGLTA